MVTFVVQGIEDQTAMRPPGKASNGEKIEWGTLSPRTHIITGLMYQNYTFLSTTMLVPNIRLERY
jgi:hypothetical protein